MLFKKINNFLILYTAVMTLGMSNRPLHAQSILNYFNSQLINGQVVLNWEIRLGNTCDGIEIQHSTDSLRFHKIGEIAGVCGSKSETIAYQFKHTLPVKNKINWYRLALGGFGFSELEAVEALDFKSGYLLKPNPANSYTLLILEDPVSDYQLRIFDMQACLQINYKGQGNNIRIDVANWKPGIYFFTIQTERLSPLNGRIIKI